MTTFIAESTRTYLPLEDFTNKQGFAARLGGSADPAMTVRLGTQTNIRNFVGVILYEGRIYTAATAVEVQSRPRVATIQTKGSARCIANGAVAMGDLVTVHSDGSFRTAASGEFPVGVAESAASGTGVSFNVRLSTGLAPAAP